jgi:YD repeat-containing protein
MNKKPEWLIEREITIEGRSVTYSYDKEGDILEIFFQKGSGVGIDLTENIVLRFNRENEEAVSLILTNFSALTQPTKFGPPSFHLTALGELPPDIQQTVLGILNSFPVNRFLKVSGLLLSPDGELQPITYLEQPDALPLDKIPA